jgi:hypothetical protein
MSDYADVLYDPRSHTHDSCLKEVPGCDMVVLIIGSRFGGTAVPSALTLIDFDKVTGTSTKSQIEVDAFYWTDMAPDIVNPGREEQGSFSV